MNTVDYGQLPEEQLQSLYTQGGDRQAFFELYGRYRPKVLATWQKGYAVLYRKYPEDFEDFFDRLLDEAIVKWDPAKASFRTFFVLQVCRRRGIDFARSLWKRLYREKAASDMGRPAKVRDQDDGFEAILEGGCPPGGDPPDFSERDIMMFREALALEKQDCQELLRLMLYQGPKRFEEKAKVLATVGFAKKATGWRDTWKRNRERIVAYIEAHRENS